MEIETTVKPEGSGPVTVHMGRCGEKGCKHGVRVEVPQLVFLPDDDQFGNTNEREGVPAGRKWVGGKAWIGARHGVTEWGPGNTCPVHGERFRFKELKGTITASACDQVCAHATGEVCKCQCGGSNHGTCA